jgi:uncharacterized protein involved in cysteine biosynthesis
VPGVDEIFRVVGLLVVAGFLLALVAGAITGIIYGVSRVVPRVCKRVQARRFSGAAVEWAQAEYRKERFRKDHGLG